MDHSGARYYRPEDEALAMDGPLYKPSSTSIQQILSKPGLANWYKSNGFRADEIMNSKAMRGDIVHACIDDLINGIVITEDDIYNQIALHEYKNWRGEWKNEEILNISIRKMLAGFMTFMKDGEPDFLASEVMLYHPKVGWAGTADAVVMMKPRKNSKKKARILLDYKTGNAYPDHILQLMSYKMIWDAHFPGQRIQYLANLYLKDGYRDEPKYSLKIHKPIPAMRKQWNQLWNLWVSLHSDGNGGYRQPTPKAEPPKIFDLFKNNSERKTQ